MSISYDTGYWRDYMMTIKITKNTTNEYTNNRNDIKKTDVKRDDNKLNFFEAQKTENLTQENHKPLTWKEEKLQNEQYKKRFEEKLNNFIKKQLKDSKDKIDPAAASPEGANNPAEIKPKIPYEKKLEFIKDYFISHIIPTKTIVPKEYSIPKLDIEEKAPPPPPQNKPLQTRIDRLTINFNTIIDSISEEIIKDIINTREPKSSSEKTLSADKTENESSKEPKKNKKISEKDLSFSEQIQMQEKLITILKESMKCPVKDESSINNDVKEKIISKTINIMGKTINIKGNDDDFKKLDEKLTTLLQNKIEAELEKNFNTIIDSISEKITKEMYVKEKNSYRISRFLNNGILIDENQMKICLSPSKQIERQNKIIEVLKKPMRTLLDHISKQKISINELEKPMINPDEGNRIEYIEIMKKKVSINSDHYSDLIFKLCDLLNTKINEAEYNIAQLDKLKESSMGKNNSSYKTFKIKN